jgi:adenosyl cobinamide kinase/adenosyl cobinamide phosphate guanylyltransferase
VITLVLGGARSGKSRVAEQLARRLPASVTYVATAIVEPDDADHAARVDAHRARRDPSWVTEECGAGLIETLARVRGSVLIDSLGTWVTAHDDFAVDIEALCKALSTRDGETVIVSEEVGLGVHPSSASGVRFRDVLGEVNAGVAEVADEVLLVVAGRTLPLGRL